MWVSLTHSSSLSSLSASKSVYNLAVCRELEIIHTDLKPENVMLGRPLASREWRLSASQAAAKELMAAALAAAKAENRTVTKNQKKKLKKKIKKQLTAAASAAATAGSTAQGPGSVSAMSADLDGSTANSDLAACQVSLMYVVCDVCLFVFLSEQRLAIHSEH